MDSSKPIYSEVAQCQDCYRCVRECPVKAIKVTNNQASIMSDLCIACGHCVTVCPSGAKSVRDDLNDVKSLLNRSDLVIVSLAPSFVSEFHEVGAPVLIRALKMLGFHGVSETALGAQQVSAQVAMDLDEHSEDKKFFLSSACPVAVEYVMKYQPRHAHAITRVFSPLLAHCKLLKERLGPETRIVFIGPCIAKKLEASYHPELLDAALTFEDLRRWLDEREIRFEGIVPTEDDRFIPEKAEEGSLYPIEGGMLDATRLSCRNSDIQFISLSGIGRIEKALQDIDANRMPRSVFLELLACEGGCVNGPKTRDCSTIKSRLDVLDYAHCALNAYPRKPSVAIDDRLKTEPVDRPSYTEEQIRDTLLRIGKHTADDELNCGGCGYHSCRELAAAILSGKAETNMCVSYMRQLAQKKANAILRTLPCAAVLVDHDLKVIECNDEFALLGGEDVAAANEVVDGLTGATLKSIIPFADLFQGVLDTGEDIIRKYVRCREKVLSTTIFSVEPHRVVGAILIDVTNAEMRREQIVEKAQQVIQNTLSTVQDIAFRLGKSAAESELILNSIVDNFSATEYDDKEVK
jgi:iron only hydrogenase large subunit-like protein